MVVGILRLALHLPAPGSLKSKRHLVRSAIDRVRSRFDVAIAEVGDNDLWQRAVLGAATVGNDAVLVGEVLGRVADFVASVHGGQIQVLSRDVEIQHRGDGLGDDTVRTMAEAEGLPPMEDDDEHA